MVYAESGTVEDPIIKWLEELGWKYLKPQQIQRKFTEAFDKPILLESLLELNQDILQSENDTIRVIDRISNLSTGIRGNKEFFDWLKNEASIILRPGEMSQTIRLIDYNEPENNTFTYTNQYAFHGYQNIRPDIVLFINGIPLILIECKTQTREEIDYTDAINQIIRYNNQAPQLFRYLAYSCATDGANFRYGWTTPNRYARWRNGYEDPLEASVKNLFQKERVLDFIKNFIVFETFQTEITKKIAMQQQFEATNRIIHRVLQEEKKNGLIWHTQGSGKTLTMLFTAWKLKRQPELRNPTIIILIDRKQLEKQFRETFTNVELPYTRWVESIRDLQHLIRTGSREVLITTIQKFQDIEYTDPRDNIIILIDEAHRSQYGKLAIKRDHTFPNASLFAFTGTPVDRDYRKDTFDVFGYREEEELYLHKYSIRQSIEDGSTVPLIYEPRLTSEHVPRGVLDREFLKIATGLDKDEQEEVLRKSARLKEILKGDERVRAIAEDIAEHYTTRIEPNGHKAMVVTVDREACAKIKQELDRHLPPEYSRVIYSAGQNDPDLLKQYHLDRSKQLEITRKDYQEPDKLPKILIVTNMLLTGFDAPILKAMYLDKPLRDHNLLQAIARTNRPYAGKGEGIIVDYLGIFYRLQEALNFEIEDIEGVADGFEKLKGLFEDNMEKLRELLVDQPRDDSRESLYTIIRFLETGENLQRFKELHGNVTKLFESISPDRDLYPHLPDYTWFQKINAAYNKHARREKDSLKPYQEKTRKLIQEKLVLDEIDETLPTFEIGPDYLAEIENVGYKPEDEVAELRQALSVHLRLNLGSLRFYETLSEKLERILKGKDPEQMKKALRELVREDNAKEEEMKEKGLSKMEYALLDSAEEYLEASEEELIPFIKELVEELEPHLFDGWNLKDDTRKRVQLVIFSKMHDHYREKVDSPRRLLELRDELIRYIERYRS